MSYLKRKLYARRTLADWPLSHFNYRAAEVRQMLGLLDEAIALVRAGKEHPEGKFDANLALKHFLLWLDTHPPDVGTKINFFSSISSLRYFAKRELK